MTILGNELLAFGSFNVFSSCRSPIKQRYQLDSTFNIVPIAIQLFKRSEILQIFLHIIWKNAFSKRICKDSLLCFFSLVPVCLIKNACRVTRCQFFLKYLSEITAKTLEQSLLAHSQRSYEAACLLLIKTNWWAPCPA